MTANYPAFDFPLYGLGTGWDGPRWLDFFEGKLGEPAWAVWLMHAWNRHGPPTPWVLVGMMPAERYARLMVPPSKDLARELAHKALFTLLNRITPALPEPDRGLYWSRAMVMTDRAADDYGAWERVTWRVDGVPVPARTRTWAGVRVGFTAVPGVSIVVLDARPAAAEVGLEQVSDGTAYHFRADAPLNYPGDLEAAARAALGNSADSEPESWLLHEDQVRLLRETRSQ